MLTHPPFMTLISLFVVLSFRKEALACYFDLILSLFLSNINLMKASIMWKKINPFKVFVHRTTALLILLVPQIFWMSGTIHVGQALILNAECGHNVTIKWKVRKLDNATSITFAKLVHTLHSSGTCKIIITHVIVFAGLLHRNSNLA